MWPSRFPGMCRYFYSPCGFIVKFSFYVFQLVYYLPQPLSNEWGSCEVKQLPLFLTTVLWKRFFALDEPRVSQIKTTLQVGSPRNHQIGQIMTVLYEWALKELQLHSAPLITCQAAGKKCMGIWQIKLLYKLSYKSQFLLRFSFFFNKYFLDYCNPLFIFQSSEKVDSDYFC